jgi:serine/threonine-protein kinase
MPALAAESRLQLHGEIARGGMGAVLKGRDANLGRDVAVKVLLEAHQEKPELVRRFVEEAQIGGQLQHPERERERKRSTRPARTLLTS